MWQQSGTVWICICYLKDTEGVIKTIFKSHGIHSQEILFSFSSRDIPLPRIA
jgi:hypothetical protein